MLLKFNMNKYLILKNKKPKMKKLLIYSTFLSIIGCQPGMNPIASISSNSVSSSGCADKPTGSLSKKDVEEIVLNEGTITKSGQVNASKYHGYTFTAKSGEKLVYKTNQDICIWVYTPDNQLINSPILPLDGNYTVQVAAMGGSTTFDLALQLQNDADKSLSSAQPTPLETSQTNIENSPRKDAADFIRNHYLSLNNREYSQTRNQLSNQFKNKYSGTYAEYQQWWDSVKEIKIGDVKIVNDNGNNVTLDVELWYYMNTGKIAQDSRSRIYLIWNQNDNRWLINDKSEP
jgi:hypothetical protein